jgi:hypothetical protein
MPRRIEICIEGHGKPTQKKEMSGEIGIAEILGRAREIENEERKER